MATILYIECDRCGRRSSDDFRNAGMNINFNVRPLLKAKGWSYRNQKDYCPECTKKLPPSRSKK